MAESLVSTEDLNIYLASIDTNATNNKRVLAALQTLHPNLLADITYYLVNGVISINKFYTIPLNNQTAAIAIQEASASNNTIRDKAEFYRAKVRDFETYTQFLRKGLLSAQSRLSRMTISSDSLVTAVTVDSLGTTVGSYLSLQIVKGIYDELMMSSEVQSCLQNLTASVINLNSLGISNIEDFNDRAIDIISQYFFIRTTSDELAATTHADTIIGYTARSLYKDIQYRNLIGNLNTAFVQMGLGYDTDIAKLGIDAIERLMADDIYSWSSLFSNSSFTEEKIFLDRLATVVFIRYTLFTEIYGSAYFNNDRLLEEANMYTSIMDYFALLETFSLHISTKCKEFFTTVSTME